MWGKGETLLFAGVQNGLAVVAVRPCRNKMGFVQFFNSGNFLTLTVLDILNLAGEDG